MLSAKNEPVWFFGRVEATLAGERALVLGVRDDLLESRWWTCRNLQALVEGRGGFLAWSFPSDSMGACR